LDTSYNIINVVAESSASGLRFYQGGRDWAPDVLAKEDVAWRRCISRKRKQDINKTPEKSPAQELARERCERAGIRKIQPAQDLDFPSLPELYHGERVFRQTIAKLQQHPRLSKTIASIEELHSDFFPAPAAAPNSHDGWAEYDRLSFKYKGKVDGGGNRRYSKWGDMSSRLKKRLYTELVSERLYVAYVRENGSVLKRGAYKEE